MEYQITTERLSKQYKNFKAVDQVSLHIRKRSIYGFLGPNGAGKSTTMKMLLGLTPPSGGTFAIDGLHFPQEMCIRDRSETSLFFCALFSR